MADVSTQSAAVLRMAENWPLIAALMGGTTAMRKVGKAYLPKWPNEDEKSYDARLKTAVLFPAFQRTIEVLAGKPFSKAVTYGDDVPKKMLPWLDNIDLQGRNLHNFASSILTDALAFALAGILVDYPPTVDDNGRPLYVTKADEERASVRPYMVHIRPQNILGWRISNVNGAIVLAQLRLMESVEEPDGEFNEKFIPQIRVLEPGRWATYRKQAAGNVEKWILHKSGTTTLNKIPFVPVYSNKTGFMEAYPPLMELAHMNVEHWQSKSDQQTILHVARVPILVRTGAEDEISKDGTVAKKKLTVGASSAVDLPIGATLTYTEHSGAAIEAGRLSLKDLEDQMRQAGAELLVIKPANITESQTLADNEQGTCALQRITQDVEDAIDQALQFAAEWIGEKEGGHVTIYKDFGAATLAEASLELLRKMRMQGDLSRETLFNEGKRRGAIGPDVKWEDEQARISTEGPLMADA